MFKCPLCERKFEKLISLSAHYRKFHKLKAKDLYIKLFCEDIEPTCSCGCGGEVMFLGIGRGFREYIRGHAARVPGKNNWGNNKKANENSLTTRRQMIKEGTWKPFCCKETGCNWNKGLTKETDERIAKMANNILSNEEKMKKLSDKMRKNRLNGTIPTLYREQHSQWRGGVSSLNRVCKTNKKLYKNWKFPLLCAAVFTCEECKNEKPNKLDIHHNKESMAIIINKFAKKYKWQEVLLNGSDEEILNLKYEISEAVADYHIDNKVNGQVLCRDCHKKKHKNLNFK